MERAEAITPIATLLSFLKSVEKYKKPFNSMDISVKDAFCEILELEEKDLYSTLSEYLSLITLIKKQVMSNFKHTDRYITQLDSIQSAFISVGLNSDIGKFQKHITDVVINTLELCSDGLEEKEEYTILSQEQIEEIENQIAELIIQLEDSHLPKKVVFVLLHKLDDIKSAIQRYKRWGINEFEKVHDSLLGGLYKNRENINKEKNKGFLEKFSLLITTLRGVTDNGSEIVDNAIKITEKVTDFLE
ncbi:hypothetical protein CXK86_27195 [Paenibacillus sp. BGI2013]|uniref:hypothetical protein n=1 Tax=Paenibacillus sp. BGI2013 TaxID=2058902 RepID=UPI000C6CB906|nr:hypothetical protein [Paenibacillus sp. BGI2013]PKQ88138.1 hypothetical protein CXK86_27195 [Paenibacillus sp. BGI2013]